MSKRTGWRASGPAPAPAKISIRCALCGAVTAKVFFARDGREDDRMEMPECKPHGRRKSLCSQGRHTSRCIGSTATDAMGFGPINIAAWALWASVLAISGTAA